MDAFNSRFDHRSAADWLREAEHFDEMAERFKDNARLADGFRALGANARIVAAKFAD